LGTKSSSVFRRRLEDDSWGRSGDEQQTHNTKKCSVPKFWTNCIFYIMGLLLVPRPSPGVVFKSSSEDRRRLRPQTVPQKLSSDRLRKTEEDFVPKLSPRTSEVVFRSSSEDRRRLRPQTVPKNFRRRARPQTVPRSRLQVVFGRQKKSSSPNRPQKTKSVPKPSPNRPQTVFRS
jgi:hypothetical protein